MTHVHGLLLFYSVYLKPCMNSQQYLQTRGGGVSSVIDEPSFYSIIFILVFILYAIKAIWYTLFRCWGCVSAGQVSTLVSEGEGAGSCMVICTWFSEKNKNNKWNCTKVRYSKDDYLTTIQNYITLFSKRCHPKLFSTYVDFSHLTSWLIGVLVIQWLKTNDINWLLSQVMESIL